jgi:protoheme ferro-lyase
MTTRHVVLLTYGEPPTPAFGAQLAYSWRILLGLTRSVAPIPAVLLPMIALSRARQRNALWTAERYASPLEPITARQRAAVAAALATTAPDTTWRVHVAYEFRRPLLVETIERLPADEPVDVVPMYAADSAFTHEIARMTLAAWAAGRPPRPGRVRVLPGLDAEALGTVSAEHVLAMLAARNVRPDAGTALVLAAHGTLLEPQRPIETGRLATERLAAAIARRLGPAFGMTTLGWLNHTRGGRWTEPAADVALRNVAVAGYRRVVYYPYGFLADNAESELEGRVFLRGEAGLEAVHLPCLNDSPALATLIARQLAGVAAEAVETAGRRAG